jgi:hypothetical protein
MTQIDEE